MQLAGKVTAITGAASGIGLATARLFAREGAPLVLGDLDEEAGGRGDHDRGRGAGARGASFRRGEGVRPRLGTLPRRPEKAHRDKDAFVLPMMEVGG